ncbi:SDR family NAD(P)-dependent oxidoreductase [Xanthomonas campestris pv. phormiicola]|nr:SDR family NAD(P)-dependent oxidoreductase [Xanthomonas campestris pv. phormiicola]
MSFRNGRDFQYHAGNQQTTENPMESTLRSSGGRGAPGDAAPMIENARAGARVVLVTGGTAGIGLALAEAFLAQGDRVAVCARSSEALDAMRQAHPDALAVKADVADAADQAMLLDAVAAQFGRLDILVNNAGRLVERDFAAGVSDMAGLSDELAVNLTAPIQLTAATLARWPSMEAIVIVSSGYALVSPRRAPSYGAAKAGLHGFAEGLRRQLAARGTQVLEVLPPSVDTRATAHSQGRKISPEEVARVTLAALARKRPMALPGQTRWLPLLLRLIPGTVSRIVAES